MPKQKTAALDSLDAIRTRQREEVEALLERHRQERERIYDEASRQLEAFPRERAQRLIDDLIRAAYEEANGGMNPGTAQRVTLTGRTDYALGDRVEAALAAAKANARHGTTPAALIGVPRRGNGLSGYAAIDRLILVAEVDEILPDR